MFKTNSLKQKDTNDTTAKKVKPARIVFVLITSVIAICVVSFTVGRELYAGRTESIFSFGLIHFSGYLFFLLMPVEVAFAYYLSHYSEIELIAVAMVTAVGAQLIDYLIGCFISSKFLIDLMGPRRIAKAERYIRKYGTLTVFVFNLFPLSSPVIALVAGMIRFDFKKFLLVSSLGLFLKYVALVFIVQLF